jgi:hypothetical protein
MGAVKDKHKPTEENLMGIACDGESTPMRAPDLIPLARQLKDALMAYIGIRIRASELAGRFYETSCSLVDSCGLVDSTGLRWL